MKKFTSALALVALATSLAACNKPEEKKPETVAPKVVEETAKTTSTTTTSTAPGAATATTASTTSTTTTTTTSAPATK